MRTPLNATAAADVAAYTDLIRLKLGDAFVCEQGGREMREREKAKIIMMLRCSCSGAGAMRRTTRESQRESMGPR